MTREQIIRIAREAGFGIGPATKSIYANTPCDDQLERFAALVAVAAKAEEREACAKVCEENANDLSEGDWDSACINCADHIRARGEK